MLRQGLFYFLKICQEGAAWAFQVSDGAGGSNLTPATSVFITYKRMKGKMIMKKFTKIVALAVSVILIVCAFSACTGTVSYTHLTLPTILRV